MIEIKSQLEQAIETGYSYEEYRSKVNLLLEKGMTTGENQTDKLLNFTSLNVKRMNKWDKILKVDSRVKEEILSIENKQVWMVLVEAWCGDAAQNLPVIAKLSELNQNIELKIVLRDENPEIMDQYLTNGSRSIPKLVAFNKESMEEIAQWGPRPQAVQELLAEFKQQENFVYEEFAVAAHTWYAKDKGQTLQQELKELIAK